MGIKTFDVSEVGSAKRINSEVQGLRRALRRMRADQTDGRRRTARRQVRNALNRVQAIVDLEFPAPQRRVPLGKRKTAQWPPSGHAVVPPMQQGSLLTAAALHGIKAKARPSIGSPAIKAAGGNFSLPSWFLAAQQQKATQTAINKAKKDPAQRRVFLAASQLQNAPALSV